MEEDDRAENDECRDCQYFWFLFIVFGFWTRCFSIAMDKLSRPLLNGSQSISLLLPPRLGGWPFARSLG
jgi:hypothetical protein